MPRKGGGVSVQGFLEILGGGFGASRVLEVKATNLVSGTYPPTGRAAYMIKDLGFVRAESARTGVAVPQAELSMDLYRGVVEADLGDEDVSVVHALIRRRGRPTG